MCLIMCVWFGHESMVTLEHQLSAAHRAFKKIHKGRQTAKQNKKKSFFESVLRVRPFLNASFNCRLSAFALGGKGVVLQAFRGSYLSALEGCVTCI